MCSDQLKPYVMLTVSKFVLSNWYNVSFSTRLHKKKNDKSLRFPSLLVCTNFASVSIFVKCCLYLCDEDFYVKNTFCYVFQIKLLDLYIKRAQVQKESGKIESPHSSDTS